MSWQGFSLEENMSNFLALTVPADGLALQGYLKTEWWASLGSVYSQVSL